MSGGGGGGEGRQVVQRGLYFTNIFSYSLGTSLYQDSTACIFEWKTGLLAGHLMGHLHALIFLNIKWGYFCVRFIILRSIGTPQITVQSMN